MMTLLRNGFVKNSLEAKKMLQTCNYVVCTVNALCSAHSAKTEFCQKVGCFITKLSNYRSDFTLFSFTTTPAVERQMFKCKMNPWESS